MNLQIFGYLLDVDSIQQYSFEKNLKPTKTPKSTKLGLFNKLGLTQKNSWVGLFKKAWGLSANCKATPAVHLVCSRRAI